MERPRAHTEEVSWQLVLTARQLRPRAQQLRFESSLIRAESARLRLCGYSGIKAMGFRNVMPVFLVLDPERHDEERPQFVRLQFRKITNPDHLRLLFYRLASNPL